MKKPVVLNSEMKNTPRVVFLESYQPLPKEAKSEVMAVVPVALTKEKTEFLESFWINNSKEWSHFLTLRERSLRTVHDIAA